MINLEFWQEPGMDGVSMDIVDFLVICQAGRDKNVAFFDKLLEAVYEVSDEKDLEIN